ncbi:MAG: UvrD-helicase domain-containing protein [Clostridia bacterium]
MKLNEFQQAAVNEPPKDITVSAAAGSGKTQVLGERVLRRISGDRPVDVNRLLIVTFTRSAAAEMRSRISRSVSSALKTETDPKRRRNLERQLSLVGGADICTIDSFCYRILKQNFFRVPNLSGDFTVGDEGGVRLISSEAMRETVEMFCAALEKSRGGELIPPYEAKAERFFKLYPHEEKAAAVLEGFANLAGNYGSSKKTSDFISADDSADYIGFVRSIRKAVASVPDPEQWLDRCAADYSPETPFEQTRLSRFAAREAAAILEDLKNKISGELQYGGLNTKNTATFSATLDNLNKIKAPETYADAFEIFSAPFPKGGSVSSKDTKKEAGNPHAAAVMARAKDIWEDMGELFKASPEEAEVFREKIYPAVLGLCELTKQFINLETEKMLEKKKLSFSACVQLTLELLTNPDGTPSETALELQSRYDEIYVDEAQDIDPRQLALFTAISRENLFMVGDVKQSIYGFRYAEPEIFNSRPSDGENSRLITMNLNYRSNNNVISAVNGVFGRLMNESTMGVDYENGHKMLHGEDWLPKNPPRCEFLSVVDEERYRTYKFDIEAQAVANRINALIESKMTVYDKASGGLRPVEYRDIMVLMRSVKDDGPVMEEVLTENNIPCYFDGGEGLFSRGEISSVVDVLSLIDNPLRDIPLAGVLRSVMFGFTENDLLRIRSVSTARSFSKVFAVLCDDDNPRHGEYAQRLEDDELLSRCLGVGECMKRWRAAADFRPISEVIGMIVTDTGFYSSVGALPSGARRRANIDLLMDAAEEFEAAGNRGLFSFIEYIKKQEMSGGGSSLEAKTLSDSMNVVRIMTIHKSKGLEAPVVILAKTSKLMSSRGGVLAVNTELGFCADYINEEKGYRYKSPMNRLINYRNRSRERTEEIRLLYVAMTRPRELFIATGYFPNRKELDKMKNFDGNLSRGDVVFTADSYAKMMGTAVDEERLWRCETVSADEVKKPVFSEKLRSASAFSESVMKNLNNLLGFSYEYEGAENIPAKVSVSALKAADYDETAAPTRFSGGGGEVLRRPAFAEGEEKISNAQLGTAYHAVMENIDFSRPVTEQIDAFAENGIISPAERKLIKDERISALLDSPLGQKMKNAEKLWREAPFMIDVPASELEGTAELRGIKDETVAVQGIIDCFFEDGDEIILVDYKTDVYSDPSEVAEKYKKQLEYYAKALKIKFSDKKLKKYLYLFFKGDIIEVN